MSWRLISNTGTGDLYIRNFAGGQYGIEWDASANTRIGSGAIWANDKFYGNGYVGMGTSSPTARLHIISTAEQLRIGYDISNYYKTTVGSTGGVTFDAVGSGAKFVFSDALEATTVKATTAGGFVSSDGSTGFTGTGAYTNFTIKDGIITAAS